jgi:hypothetical protein
VVIVLARALHARARDWLGGSSGVAAAPRPCPVTSPALDTPELTELVYELLDAHADTAELVADHALEDERWCAHLEYLQALQRHGRGLLARACVDEAA